MEYPFAQFRSPVLPVLPPVCGTAWATENALIQRKHYLATSMCFQHYSHAKAITYPCATYKEENFFYFNRNKNTNWWKPVPEPRIQK